MNERWIWNVDETVKLRFSNIDHFAIVKNKDFITKEERFDVFAIMNNRNNDNNIIGHYIKLFFKKEYAVLYIDNITKD